MRFIRLGVLGLFAAAAACSGPGSGPPEIAAPQGAVNAVVAPGAQGRVGMRSGRARRLTVCSGSGTDSFVGGMEANVAGGQASGVLSGAGNQACDTNAGIGTGSDNTIASGSNLAENAFIGAGLQNLVASGLNAFIGAGNNNTITGSAYAGVIGGGSSNTLNGSGFSGGAQDSVIGGGYANTLAALGANGAYTGVIAGGYKNSLSGQYAAIVGGSQNTASGTESTVAGGGNNTASGYASFAAGFHADAAQGGSFVWSDTSSSAATKAAVANQFVARASGGVEFFSNKAMTTGVKLAAGGGSWASLSDRAVKANIEPIDDSEILNKVAAMPITQWSYISEHGIRHVGPMAQDFYAAFGIGEDNKHITSIDEDGVALAAIKALHAQLRSTNARLAQKDAALRLLHRQMSDLRSQVRQEFIELRSELTALRSRS